MLNATKHPGVSICFDCTKQILVVVRLSRSHPHSVHKSACRENHKLAESVQWKCKYKVTKKQKKMPSIEAGVDNYLHLLFLLKH